MDLLSYLASSSTTSPYDLAPHCSLSQLKEGGVKLQVLPVFTKTGAGSEVSGAQQLSWYEKLVTDFSNDVSALKNTAELKTAISQNKIFVLPAIENCSSFASEDESLDIVINRLEEFISRIGRPVYASLTWFGDNRFGGGNDSARGLSDDGKELIEFFRSKNVAIDISHAGEKLVEDILSTTDFIISSHSNARAKKNMQRNLTDDVIKEVIKRGGLLGVNACRRQHGDDSINAWFENVEHMLKLGAEELLCFGTDFFFDKDYLNPGESAFFSDCPDASKMQLLVNGLTVRGHKDLEIHDVCHRNVEKFLQNYLMQETS